MRSIRTHIEHIPLREWFPPKNPISATMARLCILREDLYLELRGMVREPLPTLDECSDIWREIYFFRNSVRTLLEIRSASETLRTQKSFMQALAMQPRELGEAFDQLSKALSQAHGLIKKLRNEVSGHISHKAIEKALEKISPDTRGLLQAGDRPKDTHYKFALEFVGAAMLRRIAPKNSIKKWRTIRSTTIKLFFKAIKAIDLLFAAYSRIYDLRIY